MATIGKQYSSIIVRIIKGKSLVLNKQTNSTSFDDPYCLKYRNKNEKLT